LSDEEIRKLERDYRANPEDFEAASAWIEAKARACSHTWFCYIHPSAIYSIACPKCKTWRGRPGDVAPFTEGDILAEWQDPDA